jgi:hypothetical protein
VYHPFPDSGAVWNFNCSAVWGCGPPQYLFLYENYSIIINGDTTINSQQYHKLNIPFVQSNCPNGPIRDSGYAGCIRQDTALRKIYFVCPNSIVDSLLYDFNMQVGDTVPGLIGSWASLPDTVISIDSILVGSDYRKRWYINHWYNIYLIEGIGSTFGLKEFSPGSTTDFPNYSLSCFTQNGITLYPSTSTICNIIDGVINSSDENTFSLVPNPATNEFKVQSAMLKVEAVEVYDVVGKRVKALTLNPSPSGEGFSVEVSSLAEGIYFVRIKTENGSVTKKLIKQ